MPQIVDPFIPVQPPYKHTAVPVKRIGNSIPPRHKLPRQNLEQLRPWYNVQKPQVNPIRPAWEVTRQQSDAEPQAVHTAASPEDAKPDATHRPSRLFRTLKYPALGALVLIAGLMLQIALIGEILIAAYALFAIVRRIESRTTFILALISFGYIILMLFVHSNADLMKNFAMYAFLFLTIGAVSLLREAHY